MHLTSQFRPQEEWDALYTWESLEEHEPKLTSTYSKKVTKPSLMVVVALTTTKIGDDYFLNKLHEPASTKRKSVYYSTKVSGKRNHSASGYLSLLWRVISKCSFWLLPYLEALGAHVCMWRL